MRPGATFLLVAVFAATASFAEDPMLKYRAPSLAPHGGAATDHRSAASSAAARHAAEINARAHGAIEATVRDNMRSIDDGVIERLGNPSVLPQVRRQRELEEDMAGMRQQQRLDGIESNLERYRDSLGRPLGPVTRRVLERSGIQLDVLRRKQGVARDVDQIQERIEEAPAPPELGDLVPREPRIGE